MNDGEPHHAIVWECDHMRLVVRDDDDAWRHVNEYGRVEGICHAGAYRVGAAIVGKHNLGSHYRAVTP